MLPDLYANGYLVLAVLVFVAVLLLLEAGYLFWRSARGAEARKLRMRIAAATPQSNAPTEGVLRRTSAGGLPAMDRALRNTKQGRWLAEQLRQSGLSWSVSRLLISCVAVATLTWNLLTPLIPNPLLAIAGALLCATAPWAYVRWKRSRRLAALERQLPDVLDLLGRALRAGHAFSSALKMAGEEMPEPIAAEFRLVHDEVNYGISLQQALTHLSELVPLMDVRYFVVAVLIQRESGGNLTEILNNLSRLIRERFKLFAKVRVLSADGRLSAWIMGLLPFGLGALLNIFNPKFMSPLWTDPLGQSILQYVLALMAIGVIFLVKIARIRV